MATASRIDEVVARMEVMQRDLDRRSDQRRHWHGVYRRGTVAIGEDLQRGGFDDVAWLTRLDVLFAGLYLNAMEAWDRGETVPGPWRVAFEAAREGRLPPLQHVLLGLNAHVNFDLPQALLLVLTDAEFADPAVVQRRYHDYQHVDDVLLARVGAEDRELAAADPRARSLVDRLLRPVNHAASRRFISEARIKVFRNAGQLSRARQAGPEVLATRLAELEELCRARVADLRAPGPVLLKLALRGFGVVLPSAPVSVTHVR